MRIALLSLILLVPCFWQRRIQAGDLSSHIYNSWLAEQIELGKAPGLTIVPLTTNVLFDLLLSRLYRLAGPETAQRIAVSFTVLIFFWGAFMFVRATSRGHPWFIAPCLLMLTHGWVFHMGFFNFYLAAGLSLWALTLSLRPGVLSHVGVVVLLAIAYSAHAIPCVWTICVIAYTRIAQSLVGRSRLILFAVAAGAVLALRFAITNRYHSQSTFHQVLEASAVDQVWVFGIKYFAISVGLAMLWGFLLLRIYHIRGIAGTIGDTAFQLCVLMALGILVIPSSIELPQYQIALSFVTERMTLLYAVLICAFLAAADPPAWLKIAFVPLAALYFSLLFVDTDALNKVEMRMEALTAGLSAQDRVFCSFEDPNSRVQLWEHNLDRVCLARCASYANYEPFTRQFRIRALRQNPLVVASALDFSGLQVGGYVVKQSDLPFYQITLCGEGSPDLCLRPLKAGDVTRHDQLTVTPAWW